ncbi:hypothetical protein [Paenibacillus sp. SI8]|uniref:hypothetical protein n=1 Tax=unclassified Paenibacillus TaxID=185978 RepID=UPI0034659B03
MSSEFYQRELSQVEKKYQTKSLDTNKDVKRIIQYFVKEGFIKRENIQFELKKSTQLQTEDLAGTVTEVVLTDDVSIWYSNFRHLDYPDIIEKVTGTLVKNKKEHQFEVENGAVKLVREGEVIETISENDSVTPQDNCFVHGNWCGPGCSGPSAPVDAVDTCCMIHDQCYATNGYFNCQCDWNLLDCLKGKSGWAAFVVRTYFAAAQIAGACS